MLKSFFLFTATAAAEISGCYAMYLWLRLQKPAWWLLPGAAALALFAWLLTLHPQVGAGRVYAAYGGVYIAAAMVWLWAVEGSLRCRRGRSFDQIHVRYQGADIMQLTTGFPFPCMLDIGK